MILALALSATALTAQGYRVRLDTRAQTVAYKAVVLDSILKSDTVGGPTGGPVSPDGYAVTCAGSNPYCQLFRPGPTLRATPVTVTADIAVWGFGVPGLSARGTVSASGDLASANAWPGNDPGLQLYIGYLEYAASRFTVRGGRQIVASRLGMTGFDGAAITIRDLIPGLELDAYGGLGLELGTALAINSPALDPLNDFRPQQRQLLAGMGASVATRYGSARVNYEREVDPRSDYFVSERFALQAVAHPLNGVNLTAGADFDLAAGEWGSAEATLGYTRAVWSATAGVRRYRPHFELWTIWGAFSPVPYHAVTGQASVRAGSRVWLRVRAESYAFEPSDATTARPAADWTVDAGIHGEHGPGASSRGLEGSVSWSPVDRPYSITAHAATLLRPLEFRYSESDLLMFGLEAQAEPSSRVRLSLGAARYAETRDRPDAAAFDFNQVRIHARVVLSFGAGDGLGGLPPAVRRMPGGRAARGSGA